MEDVELHHGHAVQRALDHVDRLEVAAHIDHEPAPAEARCVIDGDGGRLARAVFERNQLQECLHSAHGADIGCRTQLCVRWRDRQLVAFVFIHALHRFAGAGSSDSQHGGRAGSGFGLRAENASALAIETGHHAIECGIEARVVIARDASGEMLIENQMAGARLNRARQRHEAKRRRRGRTLAPGIHSEKDAGNHQKCGTRNRAAAKTA